MNAHRGDQQELQGKRSQPLILVGLYTGQVRGQLHSTIIAWSSLLVAQAIRVSVPERAVDDDAKDQRSTGLMPQVVDHDLTWIEGFNCSETVRSPLWGRLHVVAQMRVELADDRPNADEGRTRKARAVVEWRREITVTGSLLCMAVARAASRRQGRLGARARGNSIEAVVHEQWC